MCPNYTGQQLEELQNSKAYVQQSLLILLSLNIHFFLAKAILIEQSYYKKTSKARKPDFADMGTVVLIGYKRLGTK